MAAAAMNVLRENPNISKVDKGLLHEITVQIAKATAKGNEPVAAMIDNLVNELKKSEQIKDDAFERLLKSERENTRRIIDALNKWNAKQGYGTDKESIKDSMREVIEKIENSEDKKELAKEFKEFHREFIAIVDTLEAEALKSSHHLSTIEQHTKELKSIDKVLHTIDEGEHQLVNQEHSDSTVKESYTSETEKTSDSETEKISVESSTDTQKTNKVEAKQSSDTNVLKETVDQSSKTDAKSENKTNTTGQNTPETKKAVTAKEAFASGVKRHAEDYNPYYSQGMTHDVKRMVGAGVANVLITKLAQTGKFDKNGNEIKPKEPEVDSDGNPIIKKPSFKEMFVQQAQMHAENYNPYFSRGIVGDVMHIGGMALRGAVIHKISELFHKKTVEKNTEQKDSPESSIEPKQQSDVSELKTATETVSKNTANNVVNSSIEKKESSTDQMVNILTKKSDEITTAPSVVMGKPLTKAAIRKQEKEKNRVNFTKVKKAREAAIADPTPVINTPVESKKIEQKITDSTTEKLSDVATKSNNVESKNTTSLLEKVSVKASESNNVSNVESKNTNSSQVKTLYDVNKTSTDSLSDVATKSNNVESKNTNKTSTDSLSDVATKSNNVESKNTTSLLSKLSQNTSNVASNVFGALKEKYDQLTSRKENKTSTNESLRDTVINLRGKTIVNFMGKLKQDRKQLEAVGEVTKKESDDKKSSLLDTAKNLVLDKIGSVTNLVKGAAPALGGIASAAAPVLGVTAAAAGGYMLGDKIIRPTLDSLSEKVTGKKGQTLGGAIYDFFNKDENAKIEAMLNGDSKELSSKSSTVTSKQSDAAKVLESMKTTSATTLREASEFRDTQKEKLETNKLNEIAKNTAQSVVINNRTNNVGGGNGAPNQLAPRPIIRNPDSTFEKMQMKDYWGRFAF
jgi:hypothetical protein